MAASDLASDMSTSRSSKDACELPNVDLEKVDPTTVDESKPQTDVNSLVSFPPGDPEDPHAFSLWRKYIYALILGYGTFSLTFCSSAYSASLPEIMVAFDASYEVAILGISLFVLAFAAGPLLWGPASEVFGRRPVYFVAGLVYTAFSVGVAFANNTTALLIMRFLAAFGGSAFLSNPPASGGDFCDPIERFRFAAIYGATLFSGPALGPCICGFVTTYAGYRWNLRLEAIIAGTAWLLVVCIPETYAPVLLRKRAERNHDASLPPKPHFMARLGTATTLPFKMLASEAIVIATSLYMALLYGILYGFFAGIPVAFVEVRGWTPDSLALAYLPIAVGALTGGAILAGPGVKGALKLMKQRAAEGRAMEPEDRLRTARFIAPLTPIGLFIFAFTSYPNVHWFGQMVGLYLFSVALVVTFTSLVPYILDCYKTYAASALAVTALVRAAYACAFPLFVKQQFEAMSVAGACGLFAGVSLLMTPIPFIFVSHGHKLRKRSRYAFV